MPDSLQLSIDLATSLSIIFAAGAFIYQQWKENYEKKELGLWQAIKEVIDTQADTMHEASKIQIQYNIETTQAGQENPDNTLETGYTEFLNILHTVKFKVRLGTKPKMKALLKRQNTYGAKKNLLDDTFDVFDKECDAFIDQMLIMRRGALKLGDRNIAHIGMMKAIFGDAFFTPEDQAAQSTEPDIEFLSLHKLFENFSEALLLLAQNK